MKTTKSPFVPFVQGQYLKQAGALLRHFPRAHSLTLSPRKSDAPGVLRRLAALSSPGSLLELQDLRPHPRPAESEPVFD